MWTNLLETVDLFTFTKEKLNAVTHFGKQQFSLDSWLSLSDDFGFASYHSEENLKYHTLKIS